MFILAGAAALWFKQKGPAVLVAKGLTVLAVLVLIVQSLLIWPHYLAYFNPIAGGPRNGYRHLIDSSLDWGQDLPGLKKWLEDHKDDPGWLGEVYLSYFGTGDPQYYGISPNLAKLLPARPDRHGTNRGMLTISRIHAIDVCRSCRATACAVA